MGGVSQVTARLMSSGNRCVDRERRKSPRASGGQLEDGRSGELGAKAKVELSISFNLFGNVLLYCVF